MRVSDMSTSLSDICVYNAKLDGEDFVGLKFEKGTLKVYFPLGYRCAENDDDRRKDILNLISVLNSFMRNDSSINIPKHVNKEKESSFPIQAYLRIIYDYLINGYYNESEKEFHKSKSGKINWNKTIKSIKPEMVIEGFVFFDFITKKTQHNESALITQIHKYFVYDAFSKLGFIFCPFMPEKPCIRYSSNLFRTTIKLKMSKTFNDRSLILFNDMMTIMDYLDASDYNNENYRYGTEEFEYIWEWLVDNVYGIPNKEHFYPHTEWHISGKVFGDNDVDYKRIALRPDTIMLIKQDSKTEAFVLDSKYYKYGECRGAYALPGTDSIVKQIAYAKYVENNKEHPELSVNGKEDIILNAFILPHDTKNGTDPEVFGYAYSTYELNDRPYHKIYGVFLDVKDLMYHHACHDNSKIGILAQKIKEYYQESNKE